MDWSCLKEVYNSRTSGTALFNLEAEGGGRYARITTRPMLSSNCRITRLSISILKNDELRVFDRAKSRANMSAGVPEAAPFGQE